MPLERILVTKVEDYSFPDSQDDKRIVEVRKIDFTDGIAADTDRARGVETHLGAQITADAVRLVRQVPGIYDAVIRLVKTSKGTVPQVVGLSPVCSLDLQGLLAAAKGGS